MNHLQKELEMFFARTRVTEEGACWPWIGYIKKSTGYGCLDFRGKDQEGAHRIAYILFVGEIPEGKQLDHLCRNRWCVNPNHLEPVTIKENVLRGNSFSGINSRKTICKRGHSLHDAYISGGNRRLCRVCTHLRYLAFKKGEKLL